MLERMLYTLVTSYPSDMIEHAAFLCNIHKLHLSVNRLIEAGRKQCVRMLAKLEVNVTQYKVSDEFVF